MKKILGLIALLASSAAVLVSPAMAHDRDDYNNYTYNRPYTVESYRGTVGGSRAAFHRNRYAGDRYRGHDGRRHVDYRYDNWLR
jgi:hypothetical protein